MKRIAFLLCCLIAASLALVPLRVRAQQQQQQPRAAQTQKDEEVETVSTALVTVPVRVSDRAGRFLTDLRREDFHVFEDNVEQEINFFETADKPFTVALLLDMSDSARFKREEIQAAARAFVAQLHAGDRVLVAAFDKNVSLLTDATGDRQVLYTAINRTRTGSGTSLHDAIQEIVGRRLRLVSGRKAVVILTDGIDTASRASQAAAVAAADATDALVYTVQYDVVGDVSGIPVETATRGDSTAGVVTSRGESLTTAYRRATLFLQMLADRTGGRYYVADNVSRLSESFARIAEELRQQYSLGYYPRNRAGEGKRRKIKVTVSAPGAIVHARAAYVFKPHRVSRRDDLAGTIASLTNN
jgi:Ca-activated chloride channel family protein